MEIVTFPSFCIGVRKGIWGKTNDGSVAIVQGLCIEQCVTVEERYQVGPSKGGAVPGPRELAQWMKEDIVDDIEDS